MNASEMIAAIARGDADPALDAVSAALRNRRQYLSEQRGLQNQAELTPGTRVRTRNLRPKYLAGLTGTISDQPARRPGDLPVEIDPGQFTGRFPDTFLSVPASCLEQFRP